MSSAIQTFLYNSHLYGKQWYDRLLQVPSRRGIVVRMDIKTHDGERHKFTHFETPAELFHYLQRMPREIRCVHEVVEGERAASKMRFDIDVKDVYDPQQYSYLVGQVLYDLLVAIGKVYPQTLVLIYDSSSIQYGKVSYHVILPEIVGKHYQLQMLYSTIMQYVPQNTRGYIDHEIYSKTKSLRILGCTKPGEMRYKVPLSSFTWMGATMNFPFRYKNTGERDDLAMFEDSLLTCLNQTKLVLDTPEPEKYDVGEIEHSASDKEILQMAASEGKFTLREKKSATLYVLNRECGGRCNICNVIHDNDNPFVYIKPNGVVMYSCRRNKEKRKKEIGHVNITSTSYVQTPEIPQTNETPLPKLMTSLNDLISLARNDLSTYKRYT